MKAWYERRVAKESVKAVLGFDHDYPIASKVRSMYT